MPYFRKYFPKELSYSRNNHVKDMRDRDWYPPTVAQIAKVKNGLFNDSDSIAFNGLKFKDSAEYKKLVNPDAIDLEPIFKQFVIKRLFPNFTTAQANDEYQRLVNAYDQKVIAELFSTLFSSTCFQPEDTGAMFSQAGILKLSKQLTYDIIYHDNAFELTTTATKLSVRHMNRLDEFGEELPEAQYPIQGVAKSIHRMSKNQKQFQLDHFAVNTSLLAHLLFVKHFDFETSYRAYIQANKELAPLISELNNNIQQYQVHLQESFFKALDQNDPLKKTQQSGAYNRIAKQEVYIEFQKIIDNKNFDKEIKKFSRPQQLALRKYKALENIKRKMNMQELAIDKANAFVQGVADNESLLKTSRNGYFVTAAKNILNVLTLGFFSRSLFHTQGAEFINNSFSLFFTKRKQEEKETNPEVGQAPKI